MNTTHNELIRKFFKAVSAQDTAFIKSNISPDGYFETQGLSVEPHYITLDRLPRVMQLTQELFPKGIEFSVKNVLTEDDLAVAEVETLASDCDGNLFNNQYLFRFNFEGDQIHHIKEYLSSNQVTAQIIPKEMMNNL